MASTLNPTLLLAVPLAPLVAAIVAGLFGQAIGLAILVVLFRNRATIAVEELDTLKG